MIEISNIIDSDGLLSPAFIKNSGLKLRLFPGGPNMIELGLLYSIYSTEYKSEFLIFDNNSFKTSYIAIVTIDSLISFLYNKFSNYGLITNFDKKVISFFDVSNEYWIILSDEDRLFSKLHLNRCQFIKYLYDEANALNDRDFFDMLLRKYEALM